MSMIRLLILHKRPHYTVLDTLIKYNRGVLTTVFAGEYELKREARWKFVLKSAHAKLVVAAAKLLAAKRDIADEKEIVSADVDAVVAAVGDAIASTNVATAVAHHVTKIKRKIKIDVATLLNYINNIKTRQNRRSTRQTDRPLYNDLCALQTKASQLRYDLLNTYPGLYDDLPREPSSWYCGKVQDNQ